MSLELVIIDLGTFRCGRSCFNCTDNRGLHCHECLICKAVWQHPECSSYMGAHNCPRCGTVNRWKMFQSDITHIDYKWDKANSSE